MQALDDVVAQREVAARIECFLIVLVLLTLSDRVEELGVAKHGIAGCVQTRHGAIEQAERSVVVVRRVDGQVLIVVTSHIEDVVDIVACRQVKRQAHLAVNLERGVGTDGETVLIVALDRPLVLIVGGREVIVGAVAAAIGREIGLKRIARTVIHVQPVGVSGGITVKLVVLKREECAVAPGVGISLARQFQELTCIEYLWRSAAVDVGDAILYVGAHAEPALAAVLRGDENDAVGAVGSVECGGRSILQHGNRLYIIGIEKRQWTDGIVLARHLVGGASSVHRHAIDNPQRLIGGRHRRIAAYTHVIALAHIVGRVGIVVNLYTGNEAVEQLVEPHLRHVLQVL